MISRTRLYGARWTVVALSLIAFLVAPVWATAGSGSAFAASTRASPQAAMVKIHMAFSTWTGYGPLVVGVKNGFFNKRGLDVSYSVVESANDREAAIRAGQLDGVATTVDTFDRWAAQGASIQVVLGIDRSAGGDGIVSKKSITTVQQLKGHTVAVSFGTVSEFFFDYVLRQNGMTIKDVNVKQMPDSSAAGAAFAAGKVDAAVTWEPWLTRSSKTGFGHILVSSARYPNIIVDAFGFRTDFVKAHPAAVRSFVGAYYDAVNFVHTNPGAAYKVIGKYVAETNAGVASDLSKVPLMTLAISKNYFGTAAHPGPIFRTARSATNFWLRLKVIKKSPNLQSLINPAFLQQM